MEDTCETYRVKRNIRLPILLEQLYQFYCSQTFTDVTLACDGNFVKCHKLILSVCSSYLEKLLTEAEAESPHPIIILVGIKLTEIKQLLEYMYKGEVILSAQEFPGFLKAAEALFVKGIGVEVEQDEQKQAPEPIVPPPVQFPLQFPFNLLFPFSSCPSPYQSMPLNSHNVLNNLPTSPNEIIQPKNIRHPSSIPLPPIFQTLPQGKSRKTKKAKTNGCTPPAKKHRCSPNVPVDARSNLPSSVCPPGGSVDIKEFISTFPDSRLSKVEKQKPDPSQETKSQLDFKVRIFVAHDTPFVFIDQVCISFSHVKSYYFDDFRASSNFLRCWQPELMGHLKVEKRSRRQLVTQPPGLRIQGKVAVNALNHCCTRN